VAPEAIYWRGVSHYKATNDHTGLGEVGIELGAKYPDNEWTLKSLPWRIERRVPRGVSPTVREGPC